MAISKSGKFGYALMSIMVLFVLLYAIYDDYRSYLALQECTLKKAVVVKTPKYCVGKNIQIFVKIENREYSLRISRASCNKYEVGDIIDVKENETMNKAFWPNSTHKIWITVLYVTLFLFFLYVLIGATIGIFTEPKKKTKVSIK